MPNEPNAGATKANLPNELPRGDINKDHREDEALPIPNLYWLIPSNLVEL